MIIRVLFGLLAASLVAALVKVLHVMPPAELFGLSSDALMARLQRIGELVAYTAGSQAQFVVPFGLIAALFAELNRIRSVVFYAVSGLLLALGGFLLHYAGEPDYQTIVNPYAGQAFLAEGLLSGLAYWLIAGRFAGWRRGTSLVKAGLKPVGRPRINVDDLAPETPAATPPAQRR